MEFASKFPCSVTVRVPELGTPASVVAGEIPDRKRRGRHRNFIKLEIPRSATVRTCKQIARCTPLFQGEDRHTGKPAPTTVQFVQGVAASGSAHVKTPMSVQCKARQTPERCYGLPQLRSSECLADFR